jgi:Spy/CpxP family protein refolding chaperone
MKTKVIAALLILSLGFNFAVIITFSHHWFRPQEFNRPPFERLPKGNSWHADRMRKMLSLTDEQVKLLEQDREELHKTLAPVSDELEAKRTELFTVLNADNVDTTKVDTLINAISLLQAKMERTIVGHSVTIRKFLTPEQQKKFRALLPKDLKRMPHQPGFLRGNMDF